MKYMGSKNRFSKYLLPILLKNRVDNQYYVEPFAGGMNIIDKVEGNTIANDNNKYLIAMFKGLQEGRIGSKIIDRDLYNDVRDCFNGRNNYYDDFTIGWIGFMGSANGRFFEGGYSGKSITKEGKIRDYVSESIRNIEKQIPKIKNIEFVWGDYRDLVIPNKSIVYCDIPYQGTKHYSTSKGFNHSRFWDWARFIKSEGHTIYISEYNAPDDFICLWEKEAKSSISANSKSGGNKLSTEKLFTL